MGFAAMQPLSDLSNTSTNANTPVRVRFTIEQWAELALPRARRRGAVGARHQRHCRAPTSASPACSRRRQSSNTSGTGELRGAHRSRRRDFRRDDLARSRCDRTRHLRCRRLRAPARADTEQPAQAPADRSAPLLRREQRRMGFAAGRVRRALWKRRAELRLRDDCAAVCVPSSATIPRAMAKLVADQRANGGGESQRRVFRATRQHRRRAGEQADRGSAADARDRHAGCRRQRRRGGESRSRATVPTRPAWVTGFGEHLTIKTPTLRTRHGAYAGGSCVETGVFEWPVSSRTTSMPREIYDCYTITVLLTLEDAGFCGKGEGMDFIRRSRLHRSAAISR